MSVFPSSRFSPAVDTIPRTAWNGFVKLRLGHSRKGSVFVVEHIFLATSSGWIFLEPSFFGPPACHSGREAGIKRYFPRTSLRRAAA